VASNVPLVTARDACVHYGARVALAPTSLVIDGGTSVAVVGPNGSGKSTLLGLLAGLIRPTSGEVTVAPERRVAFVAQQQHHHRWMPLSVQEVLVMGRYGRRGLLGRFRSADRAAIAGAAERLDVAELVHRPFGELSGGQQQRVLVAQAVASEPDLLLLDEPVTGLDLVSQQRILELIDEEVAAGASVVLSTHHLGEARRADRVLLLAGCVVADGPPAIALRADLLAEAFGDRLVPASAGTVVIDDHGHGDDGSAPGIEDLLPHHRHDHHAHGHGRTGEVLD
jgi:ABC-type Mn2+/Zn2+ transport system ATPase subunit